MPRLTRLPILPLVELCRRTHESDAMHSQVAQESTLFFTPAMSVVAASRLRSSAVGHR
jgi:hypothetical protein